MSDLILVTRDPGKLAERAEAGCEVRYGDYDRPNSLISALAGADRMLLISDARVSARVAQHKSAVDAAARGSA